MVAAQMVKLRPKVLISRAVPRPRLAKIHNLDVVKISYTQLMARTRRVVVSTQSLDAVLITSCRLR